MLSRIGVLKNGLLGNASTASSSKTPISRPVGSFNGSISSPGHSALAFAPSFTRFLATRSSHGSKRSTKSNSSGSDSKHWRPGPSGGLKKSSPSRPSPQHPIFATSASPSKDQSRVTDKLSKPRKSASKSTKGSESKSSTVIRPHIARDLERIEAARHKIRKVTGDNDTSPPGSTATSADGKTKFNQNFARLQIMGPLLRALDDMGWEAPTPVQAETIAIGIKGSNIVASAETGTGKTAAYALPMLQRIHIRKKYEASRGIERVAAPLGIILCPTRELAEQVEDQLFELGKYVPGVRIVGISGALKQPELQIRELHNGVDILVATPGRLLRLLDETTTVADEVESGNFPEIEDDTELGDLGETAEFIDELDEESGDLVTNKDGYKEDFDDGFGQDFELEDDESLAGELSTEAAWKSLTTQKPKVEQKKKTKRDSVYAEWDKAWNEIDEKSPSGNVRFKERLPLLPKGQALKNSNIDLTHVRSLALDEVDRMLAMGMFPEVRHLFKAMPRPQSRRDPNRMQVFMFTATLVPRVSELIKRFAPYHIRIDLNKAMNVAERVQQNFYAVGPRRKHALLTYLLRRRGSIKGMQTLVFCRTRQRVDRLTEQLAEEGFSVAGIHGEQSLSSRQEAIDSFKQGQKQVLIATEIMARGMDIPQLPVVINYDMPHSPEEYIHRIGRTARAGNTGTAISFVSSEPTLVEVGKRLVELDETHYLTAISTFLQKPIRTSKVPGPWRDEAKFDEAQEAEVKPQSSGSPKSKVPVHKHSKKSIRQREEDKIKPPTPVLDVRAQKVLGGDSLVPKRKVEYHYVEDDAELKSVIPPERNVVKRAKEVLTRLYDRKSKQVNHAVKRKSLSEVDDHQTALKTHVSLRDFKEGRYEDVMDEFDTKRARRLGVAVPKNLDATIRKQRDAITKKFHQKKTERKSRRHESL